MPDITITWAGVMPMGHYTDEFDPDGIPGKRHVVAWQLLVRTDRWPDLTDVPRHAVTDTRAGALSDEQDAVVGGVQPLGGTFYHVEHDGRVWFLFEDPRNRAGFGGHEFRFPLVDGTEARVVGPWSSSESSYRAITGNRAIHATVRSPNTIGLMAGTLAERVALTANDHLAAFQVVREVHGGGLTVRPFERVDCPTCDGYGMLRTATPCDGYRHTVQHRYDDGTRCPRCSDTGYLSRVCDTCRGNGIDAAAYAPDLIPNGDVPKEDT